MISKQLFETHRRNANDGSIHCHVIVISLRPLKLIEFNKFWYKVSGLIAAPLA